MAEKFNVEKYVNNSTSNNKECKCEIGFDKEFYDYLMLIDKGQIVPNENERIALSKITAVYWNHKEIYKLPLSIRLLHNVRHLILSDNNIDCIDVLDELSELKILDLDNNEIHNIQALKRLNKLQKLNLSLNHIDNINPLADLADLNKLILCVNNITDIFALSGLNNLEYLDLSSNKVKEISALGYLKKLRTVVLSSNFITDIGALSGLSALQTLDLSDNLIENVDALKSLPNMEILRLDNNHISDIDAIDGMRQLIRLDISFNGISSVGIKDLLLLENLNAKHNNLTSISLKNLPALTELNAMDNNIEELTLQGLPSLEDLALSENQISDMSAFAELEKLKSLELRHNRISEIKGLEKLHGLEELWLYDNQITELSGLDGLTGLKRLYLSNNRIKELKGMDNLESLEKLNIGENEIAAIKGLDGLKSLKSLFLSSNKIQKIESLEKLTDLEELYLGENQIKKIENISHLTKLETLDLDSNPIRELPDLGTLKNLKRVYLQNLTIKSLPRSLFELNLPYTIRVSKNNTSANVIHLNGTTLTQQPISLFVTNKRKLIKNYYDAEKEIIKEAKVMFLGDGGAGKTYTVKRLKNNGIQSDEYHTEETDTIEITEFETNKDITLKLWDFGGQEYMHSMHRCFLTARSVYVVVLSGRMGNLTSRAIYWLENINSFAKNSPVILAVNCWENDSNPGVDYEMLTKRYPNLKGEIVYSAKCSSQEKFNELTDAIIRQAKKLDGYGMEMPIVWTSIMNTITERFKTESMITRADYIQICKDADRTGIITNDIRVWLLDWFNDLGLCFSNHREAATGTAKGIEADDADGNENGSNKKSKERENYNLLKPSWLFRGIYSIIKTNEERAKEDEEFEIIDGVIKKVSIIKSIRLSANENYHQYKAYVDDLLAIMENFKLAYKASENEEFIPALCPVKMPTSFTCDDKRYKKKLQFEFRYTYLPDSVVQRLMVFGKAESGYIVENPWKSGLELIYGGLVALIHKDEIKPYLTVTIFADMNSSESNNAFEFFKKLSNQINNINVELNITANGFIIKERAINNQGDTIKSGFSVEGLLDALSKNKDIVTCIDNGVYEEYKIKDLLGMAFSNDDIKKMKESKQMENENKRGMFDGANVHIDNFVNGSDNSQIQIGGSGNKMAGRDIIEDSYNQTQTVTSVQNELDKIIELLNKNSDKITEDNIDDAAMEIGFADEDAKNKAREVMKERDTEKKQGKLKQLLGWAKEQVTDPDKAKKWLGVVTAVGSIIAKAVGA